MAGASVCVGFVSPQPGARGVWFDLAVGLPTLAFLAFLALRLKPCLHKLQRSGSDVMGVYYGLVWATTLLSAVRCVLQMTQAAPSHPTAWNVLWLATRSAMLVLEAAAVIYLVLGQLAPGGQALRNALALSGAAAGAEAAAEALYVWALHVPLFLHDASGADARWAKWSFWALHCLAGAALYAALAALPLTRWRDLLPARPAPRRYALAMLALYAAMAVGALLAGARVAAGYCVYGAAQWLYFSAQPPLLHACFLSEFLCGGQLEDALYYSEMRDAGCFDDDDGGGAGGYALG